MNSNFDLETRRVEPSQSFASLGELNRHLEHARVLRARVTADLLGAGFRALARPLRAPLAAAARWRQQRASEAALMRCSDRVLADIGIARADIPLVARGIDPHQDRGQAGIVWRPALLAAAELLAMIRRAASHGGTGRDPQTVADRA